MCEQAGSGKRQGGNKGRKKKEWTCSTSRIAMCQTIELRKFMSVRYSESVGKEAMRDII